MTKRIYEFDTWRPGYGGATVSVFKAGTTDLADIFTDESLTVAADNPLVLSSMLAPDGTRYGKFSAPLYTEQSYYMEIGGIETTGIIRPSISSLSGEDASSAVITPRGSSNETTLSTFASLQVFVSMYGEFVEGSGGVSSTNTDTLALAIAAAENGGEVNVPAGTYKINSIEVPNGVIIKGMGRESTVLQSEIGDKSFVIVGNRAGFKDITLDGVSLTADSIGVFSAGNAEIIFDSVMIKRFETGLYFKGGYGHIWNDLSIQNTEYGAKLHGDTTDSGSSFEDSVWNGGIVSVATTKGIAFEYVDALCKNMSLKNVGFDSNTGIAVDIRGAQFIDFGNCWWNANTNNIAIADDDAALTPTTTYQNDVISIHFDGGKMKNGTFTVTGTCQDVLLSSMSIEDVDFTLTTPLNNFLVMKNCTEDSNVTVAGEATKLIRVNDTNNGGAFGVTTTNTVTKAWSMKLDAGQIGYFIARVIGRGRNVAQRAVYHIGCGAYRAGSTLAYDTQTANFSKGAVVTGASSGATARIQDDSDSGATGTLTLIDIKGEFIDNEIITDDNGTPGSATVNGVLSHQNASLDSTGNVNIRAVYETNANWLAAFAANGQEVELRVTGDTSQTVEWTIDVEVITT